MFSMWYRTKWTESGTWRIERSLCVLSVLAVFRMSNLVSMFFSRWRGPWKTIRTRLEIFKSLPTLRSLVHSHVANFLGNSVSRFSRLQVISILIMSSVYSNSTGIRVWCFYLSLNVVFKGPLKYLLLPLLGKNHLAITLRMYASIGPNLDNTHRGQI